MNPYRLPILRTAASIFGGFPDASDGKESACNVGDLGSIPGLGRSPGGGRGPPISAYSAARSVSVSRLRSMRPHEPQDAGPPCPSPTPAYCNKRKK